MQVCHFVAENSDALVQGLPGLLLLLQLAHGHRLEGCNQSPFFGVRVLGLVEVGDRTFLEVKMIERKESWLVDTRRIVAIRVVKTVSVQSVNP